MVETIESFVAKLQSEGVDSGKQQAEQLLGEARQQAQQITAQAEAKADKIIADAQAEAQNTLNRSQTELALAARDVVLQLRQKLSAALGAILAANIEEPLADADFLKPLLHDLIMEYAKRDICPTETITINVSAEMHEKLAGWAISEMSKNLSPEATGSLNLTGTLKGAGFEYNIVGATIEVTLESVAQRLHEMVAPELRKIIIQAPGGGKDT